MKAAAVNLPTPIRQRLAELLGRTWFREKTRRVPTATRKRGSRNSEADGVFRAPSISHIGQLSVFTTDIGWSRAWYEDVTGLHHSRTMELEPHPFKPERQIRCCFLSARHHDECLVLIEEYDPTGKIVAPSGMSFLHFALELEGKEASPVDDGQTGRDVASGLYDPDWNYVELCRVMDAESNHRERQRDTEGHQRQAAIEARADVAAQ